MYFVPIKSPVFDYCPGQTQFDTSSVSRADHVPYLKALGLESMSGQVEILTAWMKPGDRIEIHQDIDPGGVRVPWTIVMCPVNTRGLTVEIYQPIDSSKTDTLLAPSKKHSIPILNRQNARLIGQWSLDKQGAALFSPGYRWHSLYNSSDQWQNCVSVRSNSPVVLEKIKKIFDRI